MLESECGCEDGATSGSCGTEPINPFTGLKPHFGMLLGVEDLQVSQGRPIGKLRLHNAWLHGGGCVWGLNVSFEERGSSRVLRVDPGLALDAAGQEIYLEQAVCLDLGSWFAEHETDPDFSITDGPDGGKRFSCSVVTCLRACPDRPVPAIATPCEGTGADSAYSRIEERAEVFIRPRAQPTPPSYPRLRALLGLEPEEPSELGVGPVRDEIQALDPAQQTRAMLEAFRQLAALDEIDLHPQNINGRSSLFPEEPSRVLLADLIDVDVVKTASGGWVLASLPELRVGTRRVLVPTTTLQELLAGALCVPGPDAGGPRLDPASVRVEPNHIGFTVSNALAPASLTNAAISLTAFDADGWHDVPFGAELDPEDDKQVHLRFEQDLAASAIVRLIVRGTGPQPVMGSNHIPLAGVLGGPPASRADGHDVVWVKERN
jgi:hypothetical protein